MNLIAVDTSTEACSVAVFCSGEVIARYELAPREHTKLMLPMAEEVLAEAGIGMSQLDAVAFGRGPGSFTGVRISASIAQGMALSHDLPMLPVSSLTALAQTAYRLHGAVNVLAAFDARMGEVYWGMCRLVADCMQPVAGEKVCAPGSVGMVEDHGWVAAGTGWGAYENELREATTLNMISAYPDLLPQAHDIAVLAASDFDAGKVVDVVDALPVYLRDNVAEKPRAK